MIDDIIEGIIEILFEIFFEPLWNFIFYSETPKWLRTMIYLLITQSVTIVLACIVIFAKDVHQDGRDILSIIAAVWCIATVIFGFYMLNRKRKKS